MATKVKIWFVHCLMKFHIVTNLGPPENLECLTIQEGENMKITISMQHSAKFDEFITYTLCLQSAIKFF